MSNKSTFAENLKHYMKLNKKTRKEICNDLGYSYFTFSDWVNGKKYPRMDKVEQLANYFGILKSDLIEDKDNEIADKNTALVAKRIKDIRLSRGLSVNELAEELGITSYELEQYEKGRERVPFELVRKMSDYFGIDALHNLGLNYELNPNETRFDASMRILAVTDRWNKEVGETQFTDDEMTKLIGFARYLISERGNKK